MDYVFNVWIMFFNVWIMFVFLMYGLCFFLNVWIMFQCMDYVSSVSGNDPSDDFVIKKVAGPMDMRKKFFE